MIMIKTQIFVRQSAVKRAKLNFGELRIHYSQAGRGILQTIFSFFITIYFVL